MPGTPPQTYDGIVAVLPTGRAGMVAHENRLFSSAIELLDAQGVTMEDRHLRKEAGVSNFDAAGVASAPRHQATLGVIHSWIDALITFPGSGITFTGSGKTAQASVGSGTTNYSITVPTGGYAAGNLIVVLVALYNNFDNGKSPTSLSVTDAAGNTYSFRDFGDPGLTDSTGFVIARLFYSKLTNALSAGQLITVNYGGGPSSDRRTAICAEFTGLTGTVDRFKDAADESESTTATDSGQAATLQSVPQLIVGMTLCPGQSSESITPDATYAVAKKFSDGTNRPCYALDYRIESNNPTIIAIQDWHSGLRTASGGTKKAATTAGSATVTGSGGTAWLSEIFPGDRLIIYDANNMEERTVLSVSTNTSLTTTEPWSVGFGASDYVIVVGPRLICATTGGTIFKERSGNLDAVTLASNLSKTARPGRFIICGKEDGNLQRKLIYVNGYNIPQGLVDDGATMAAISTPNADWDTTATNAGARPWNGVVHRERVVLVCPRGKDPHRLYFSSPTNHGDFNTTGQATQRRVRSDIGDQIWGLASFQGVLWVWKSPVGVFYIDDSDLDATNWVERTKSQAIGCAPSPYAVCPMDDDVIFMSATGAFHVLSAVDTLGGVKASDLSWHLGLNKWLRENLNLNRLGQTLSVWYPHKKVALFSVPGVGSTVNNLMLKWDFSGVEHGEPVKFSYSFQSVPDALALRRDTDDIWKPVVGEGPYVKLLDRAARNKEGVGYTSRYQTPHIDFSHLDERLAWKRKLYEHLELVMEPVGAGTLTVEVFVDGVLKQTLTYDATKRRQRKLLRVGDGHTISLRVTCNTVNEDFKVLAHLVYFKPGNEDQSR